ncbi:MAG: HupE/UreJ family protein [Proteobacteria bacterium]|nr:HupE/UreJ family protein [Pseudomonadota bacterium]
MRQLFLLLVLSLLGSGCLLGSGSVQADEYRPAFLELRQTANESYDVLWKVPARGDLRLGLYVRFPGDVQNITPVRGSMIGGAYIERYSISRAGGLAGSEIVIEGLSTISTDVLVRIERMDGSTQVARLVAANPSFVVGEALTRFDVVSTYTVFGVEHILEGIDHLLFVACLVLIAGTGRRILITITGFTFAHSITLTLAALNLVRLPIPPIEAVIALSIVFLAREIALDRRDTLTWRYPIAVSGTFGLLHGFGFASALSEIGLPQTEIPAALLAFNVGVEIGQIIFVGAIITAVLIITTIISHIGIAETTNASLLQAIKPLDLLRRIEKPLAYIVGGISIIWTLERTAVFWT